MPGTAVAYNGYPMASYVDLRALERVTGAAVLADENAYRALPPAEQVRWVRQMLRPLTSLPPGLAEYASTHMASESATLDQAMGIDFFAIDRVLGFGSLGAHEVTILGGEDDFVDPLWVSLGLEGRGFVEQDEQGVVVWSRFIDGVSAVSLTDLLAAGDPFDAEFNRAERIAIQPGRVTVASYWSDLRETLDAAHGRAPQGHSAKLIEALFAAAAKAPGSDGTVVQGWVQGFPTLGTDENGLSAMLDAMANPAGDINAVRERIAEARRGGGPPLSAYPLALFAEVGSTDGGQVNLISIPYPDPATAEMAADVVSDRLNLWKPCAGTRCAETLIHAIGGTVTSAVILDDRVGASLGPALIATIGYDPAGTADPGDVAAAVAGAPAGEGGAIAVIAVHYPAPPADDPDIFRGRLMRVWQEAILDRDMTLLVVP